MGRSTILQRKEESSRLRQWVSSVAFEKKEYRSIPFLRTKKGDCYVAAAGLPLPASTPVEPAVRMARFARDCMREMEKLSAELEVSLVSSSPAGHR